MDEKKILGQFISDFATILWSSTDLRSFSWAPITPENRVFSERVLVVANMTVPQNFNVPADGLDDYCRNRLRELGIVNQTGRCVVMLTSVRQERIRSAEFSDQKSGLNVLALCTAGLGNGFVPGDPAPFNEGMGGLSAQSAGTINLMVVINRPLTEKSLAEAASVAVMSKTHALVSHGAVNGSGRGPIAGTGTDCIVIVCPNPTGDNGPKPLKYSGMGTVLGEAVGKTVSQAVLRAIGTQNGDGIASKN
ncbi:adenosylcobinamide amidohydrolase [Candidatus Uhrbacteria bacterium]|nr:adenosylcobinamide amidohydrolase [Candidatus Uhrbacteria bacterium]